MSAYPGATPGRTGWNPRSPGKVHAPSEKLARPYPDPTLIRPVCEGGCVTGCEGGPGPVRGHYLSAACEKTRHLGKREKWLDDPLFFPFSHTCALKLWARATKKVGLYEVCRSSGRQTWHPHMLRTLAGHTGYLSEQYRRISEGTLSAAYLAVERNLCIMLPEAALGMRDEGRTALRRQAEMIVELNAADLDLQRRLEAVEGLQARMDRISALVARHEGDLCQ